MFAGQKRAIIFQIVIVAYEKWRNNTVYDRTEWLRMFVETAFWYHYCKYRTRIHSTYTTIKSGRQILHFFQPNVQNKWLKWWCCAHFSWFVIDDMVRIGTRGFQNAKENNMRLKHQRTHLLASPLENCRSANVGTERTRAEKKYWIAIFTLGCWMRFFVVEIASIYNLDIIISWLYLKWLKAFSTSFKGKLKHIAFMKMKIIGTLIHLALAPSASHIHIRDSIWITPNAF